MIFEGTNISMIRGDSESFAVNAIDGDGVQLPFEFGDTIYFTVKDNVSTEEKRIQKVITTFVDGEASIEILPEDTKNLYVREYVYDIQWNKADGTVRTIILPSSFIIKGEVTYE